MAEGTAAGGAPGVRVARAEGARAAEAFLLDQAARWAEEVRAEPGRLARPVRIVVPSNSLRQHLAARLVAAGGAQAGVWVTTLRQSAHELVRGAGAPAQGSALLAPVLVRRLAARKPGLARALAGLEDGFASVVGAVDDLLDAGFEPVHADAVVALVHETWPGGTGRRAAEVVAVAAELEAVLAEAGRLGGAGLFRLARDVLARRPDLLRDRAVWAHGYADITGVQGDLLEALLRAAGGGVVLDAPPDPAEPGTPDAGVRFLERFSRRMEGLGPVEVVPALPPTPPRLLRAPGIQAEARAAAEQAAAWIATGAEPETIGVVARDLAPFVPALRAQLERVGVPYSGAPGTAGGVRPEARPARGLVSLLRAGDEPGVDAWLDVDAAFPPAVRRDLRLALHAIGRVRLGQVAALPVDGLVSGGSGFGLPVRSGLDEREDAMPGEAPLLPRRRLRREVLEEARTRAAALIEALIHWPETDALASHLKRLRGLLTGALGWRRGSALRAPVFEALAALEREVGGAFAVSRSELEVLVERALAPVGRDPLGGAGAGVAVLSAMEARGRTFRHLFVLGLNRDLFPRTVTDDPLLPDALRVRIERDLLPDLPVKRRGFDEERYLFAQLCASADEVVLAHSAVSDDGKERPPSPFAERVRLAAGGVAAPAAPPWLSLRDAPVPLDEAAALAGADGYAALQRGLLALALGEAGEADGATRAEARLAVVAELDRRGRRGDLGPYFGFVGEGAADRVVHVTRLEGTVRCAWQSYLERELRLEPLPDARAELPRLSPRMVGNVVHRVLERVVTAAGAPGTGPIDPEGTVFDVPWPTPARLAAWTDEAAGAELAEEGVPFPGLGRVLAAQARVLLERVGATDWRDGHARGVLGAELSGAVVVAGEGGPWTVRFRADRVDRVDEGLVLTDYKTGRPFYDRVAAKSRPRKLLEQTRAGRVLQAGAYLAGAGEGTVARYVFPHRDVVAPLDLDSRDGAPALRAAFSEAAAVVLRARDAGAFVPRLVEKDGGEPRACDWCQVRSACFQQDTGARHRLLDWLEEPGSAPGAAERAFRELWTLGAGP